jgi:outer membrane protein insertion porin family
MLRLCLAFAVCGIRIWSDDLSGKTVSAVIGTPGAMGLETRAGDPFDPVKVRHDVQRLWGTGRVSDIQVEAETDGDSIRLIFRLTPKTTVRVRKVRVNPPSPGVRVELEPGTEVDWQGAQQIAREVRKQMMGSGYPQATARAELVPVSPGTTDLEIHLDKGRTRDIESVTFSGAPGVKLPELRHALRTTVSKRMLPGIPGIWRGWRIPPAYSDEAVQSDLASLRSFYYRRGYFDVDVRLGSVTFAGDKARLAFAIESGPRFDIHTLNGTPIGRQRRYPADAVCRKLFTERREAERQGVLDFSARMEIAGAAPSVEATTGATSGPAYRVDRIEFRGNHRFSDASLRRTMLLEEGAPLDQMLLRKSLARVNRLGWFEPLTEHSVEVNTPPGLDGATVTFVEKERKSRNWYLSGPAGPMSVGGSLRFSLGSRLPSWGRGVLELSTYTLSLNLMLFAKPAAALLPFLPNRRFIRFVTVERPLLPGQPFLSGFAIAPGLGWQGMLAGYGVSQTRNLLQGLLQTDRAVTPDLLVTVTRQGREGTLRCEPPQVRLDRVRQMAGLGVNALFSFSPF